MSYQKHQGGKIIITENTAENKSRITHIDTMVLDNNDAQKREGVSPEYKKVKESQPIHLYRGRFIIDIILR